jgi:hypothetical protein
MFKQLYLGMNTRVNVNIEFIAFEVFEYAAVMPEPIRTPPSGPYRLTACVSGLWAGRENA